MTKKNTRRLGLRQSVGVLGLAVVIVATSSGPRAAVDLPMAEPESVGTVSYTHLTLPTIYSV